MQGHRILSASVQAAQQAAVSESRLMQAQQVWLSLISPRLHHKHLTETKCTGNMLRTTALYGMV